MTDSSEDRGPASPRGIATRIAHAGHDPKSYHGFVNPPVVHASTVLYESVQAMEEGRARYTYGRRGTPTTEALETALTDIEGAAGTQLAPSGLGAVTLTLLAALSAGDHLLMTDSAYHPTRHFCDTMLARLGVETTYYDPTIGARIAGLLRSNTRLVFTEAPGSLTFEMQDIPAIVDAANRAGAMVAMDNTWASPVFFRPIEHGVDFSIQAGTKYIVGHSDAMFGTVAASARAWPLLRDARGALGLSVGPDDVYLAMRGLRTLPVRLARHQTSALRVAEWLAGRPEVARVLHPALPSHPGHAIWKRDFSGSSGLFAIVLRPGPIEKVRAALDGLELFGLGYSWGGFESLAILADPRRSRTAVPWTETGHLVRLHIGLEDPEDLIADLEAGLARLA